MFSDVDGKRFLACILKYSELSKEDNPEYWMLLEKGLQILEKMPEVKPFENHDCSDFEKRTKTQFDIQAWWFKHGVLKKQCSQ